MIPNYYTITTVTDLLKLRKDMKFEMNKVLIDSGAMVNLILDKTVRRVGLTIVPDKSLSLRGYDGIKKLLVGYC